MVITISRQFRLVILSLLLCFLISSKWAKSQQSKLETGLPKILNYSAKEYKAHNQNWCMIQDSLGLIYIGNNIGLLIFDGIAFDFIPFESSINSLGMDEKGNIFYGADGDFGIIETNKFGKLKFRSFHQLIPNGFSSFTEVWSVKSIKNKILFSTKEHIYAYQNNKISIIKPAKGTGIHKCFDISNNYLVREFDGGFSYLDNNKLNFIKGSEVFAEIMVDFVQEIGNKILIGTRKNGFFTMEWDSFKQPQSCKIKPIDFPVSKYFEEGELYHGILLSNGNLCFATKNNGIYIADQQGNLIEHYSVEKGLIDNRVWYVFEDKSKNLWAASNKGVSMIDYHMPIRLYNSIQGLLGPIKNVNIINNKLYINSDLGLFEGKETKDGLIFSGHPNFKSPSFSISKFNTKNVDDLIVCSNSGLTAIRDNKTISIEEGIEFYQSMQYSKNNEFLIAAGKNLITIYKYKNNNYNLINEFEYPSQFRCIVENENGDVYISGDNKALVRVNPSLDTSCVFELIPLKIPVEIKFENFIFKHQNHIYIASENGIYEIKEQGKSINFIKSTFFPESFQNGHNSIFRAYVDNKENFWIAYDHTMRIGVIAQYKNNGANNYDFNNLYFNKFQGIQKNGFCDDSKGNLWIATNEGLLKYNTKEEIHFKNNFPVFIKQVTLKNDSSFSLLRGLIPDVLKNKLTFDLNAISFQFSAANYTGVEDLLFSSRLLPIEFNFSEWSTLRTKDYNYLPEGTYTLEVKSKDIFNNISNTKKFTFEIAPPWYRTNVAYISYFILVVALVYVLIKFNTKRLRAMNDLLEKTVKDRTHELWEERDKLHEANLEITDSINYAKIIQQSILPDLKHFKQTFKDSFIYFQPRNIVSGDFYWFNLLGNNKKFNTNLNQHIIVAADCTGHGVPGAFMSMIGSEKLNQSIAEISDLTPANILSFMNQKIKDSLKQEDGNSQSKDGMEISLCFLDLDTNILTFAGANRPLWIYRKGCKLEDVEIIKPTKAGIAGHTRADQVFEETEIQLFAGDTIYMFTDGAPDQFGGPKNKKLTTKGFRQLLFDIQSQNMEQQGKAIQGYYRTWMGNNNEQVDDILIMGIRI